MTLSVHQATWLFLRRPNELKEAEQEQLRQLRQASPKAEAAYQVVATFLQMVRERTGAHLNDWLTAVEASGIEALASFVAGVQRDKEAVQAGLTLPYSNGPLEGHINRLKLIKRSMDGRAKFDLLRLRVLYHPQEHQDPRTGNGHQRLGGRIRKLNTKARRPNARAATLADGKDVTSSRGPVSCCPSSHHRSAVGTAREGQHLRCIRLGEEPCSCLGAESGESRARGRY